MAGTSAANIRDFLTKSGSLNTASSGSLQWLVSTWNTLEFGPVLNFAFALVDLVNVMIEFGVETCDSLQYIAFVEWAATGIQVIALP